MADPDMLASLAGFVDEVAAASTTDELTQRYLARVGDHVPSVASGIYLHGAGRDRPESFAARGVSDYYLAQYERHGRSRDPVLESALRSHHAVGSHDLMGATEWTSLPVYREVFRIHQMVNVMVAPIVVRGETLGTLNFARGRDEPPFSTDELRRAELLAHLLAVALPPAQASMQAARHASQLQRALDLCGRAVVITDTTTPSRTLNAAAEDLLAKVVDGHACFEELLGRVIEGGGANESVGLLDGRLGELQITAVGVDGDSAVSTAFLTLHVDGDVDLPPVVRALLTERESDVVRLAAAGLRDGEIGEQLFISPYTVKQHLKSAYGKLGVRSRVELTRLVVG